MIVTNKDIVAYSSWTLFGHIEKLTKSIASATAVLFKILTIPRHIKFIFSIPIDVQMIVNNNDIVVHSSWTIFGHIEKISKSIELQLHFF